MKQKRQHVKWCKKRKLNVRFPICQRCWSLVRVGAIPVESTAADLVAVAILEECRVAGHNISKSCKMESVHDLLRKIDAASEVYRSACDEFQSLSRRAQQSAKRVEFLRNCVDKATEIVSEKLKITYGACRAVADVVIGTPELRFVVFSRDSFRCKHCGSGSFLTVDHIKPVKLGGDNSLDNLQTLCLHCNCKKGSSGHGNPNRERVIPSHSELRPMVIEVMREMRA